uniref:Uncharacterized protein n=1 Tax=Anguilla anguilla TaxID=7936 RepID=A0A0E9VBK8_ANGAN
MKMQSVSLTKVVLQCHLVID